MSNFEKISINEFIEQLSLGQKLIMLASFKTLDNNFEKAFLMQHANYFKNLMNKYIVHVLEHDRSDLTEDEINKLEEIKSV